MKRNNDYHYSSISSFEDLHLEKARLIMKSRLLESKINIDIIRIREAFSITTVIVTVIKKIIPSEIFGIVERIFDK